MSTRVILRWVLGLLTIISSLGIVINWRLNVAPRIPLHHPHDPIYLPDAALAARIVRAAPLAFFVCLPLFLFALGDSTRVAAKLWIMRIIGAGLLVGGIVLSCSTGVGNASEESSLKFWLHTWPPDWRQVLAGFLFVLVGALILRRGFRFDFEIYRLPAAGEPPSLECNQTRDGIA